MSDVMNINELRHLIREEIRLMETRRSPVSKRSTSVATEKPLTIKAIAKLFATNDPDDVMDMTSERELKLPNGAIAKIRHDGVFQGPNGDYFVELESGWMFCFDENGNRANGTPY